MNNYKRSKVLKYYNLFSNTIYKYIDDLFNGKQSLLWGVVAIPFFIVDCLGLVIVSLISVFIEYPINLCYNKIVRR